MAAHKFDRVTLLITHYNRSKSLEHLLKRCAEEDLEFEEVVISDDGSRPEHLDYIKLLQTHYKFRLITTPVNKGLGNNINKGQDAVKTQYTLYVQEDFEPTPDFAPNFMNAVKLMDTEEWDLIRFYTFPWAPFPYLKDYKFGYSKMLFKPELWYLNHLKFRLYSDHPHLRRSIFLEKFGRYVEGQRGDPTEYAMCMNFLTKGGKALMFQGPDLFLHEHGALEPNTMVRSKWKLSNSIIIKMARSLYLKGKVVNSTLKYNKLKQ
ncbi:glycosyltransferase family 2 protein [Mucilaginibacter terrae]|uniref:Glycosyltransferase involved in cell wall biosynthesis n=1 Tax=Mucilaginibacter terrae TaxID=1955052 RepID=A0ABU3GPD7_9SPHI|nr:glycosyltransferase family 2 protein [Mucilaginibacter terrae]MDT3401654.1 glycosyltransferase involved in cell wall biosynthesis [Mucilaginibacter terrae]